MSWQKKTGNLTKIDWLWICSCVFNDSGKVASNWLIGLGLSNSTSVGLAWLILLEEALDCGASLFEQTRLLAVFPCAGSFAIATSSTNLLASQWCLAVAVSTQHCSNMFIRCNFCGWNGAPQLWMVLHPFGRLTRAHEVKKWLWSWSNFRQVEGFAVSCRPSWGNMLCPMIQWCECLCHGSSPKLNQSYLYHLGS